MVCLTWRQSGKQRPRRGPEAGVSRSRLDVMGTESRGTCGPQVQTRGHHACSPQPGVQSFKVTVLCPPCGAGILLSSGISNICISPANTATSVQARAGERCGQALNPHCCPEGITADVHQQATVPSLLRSLLSYTHTFDPELL